MSSPSKTTELDPPLGVIGFEIDVVSAAEVNGRLRVTDRCCQLYNYLILAVENESDGEMIFVDFKPFKLLHVGIPALISEGMASMGAHVASGFRRIAGIQLSINHHRNAVDGDLLLARATPVHTGRTLQVWEVLIWKMNESTMEKEALISSSKVTILSNLPVPANAKNADIALRKYAKL